jgi:hypothetical protein
MIRLFFAKFWKFACIFFALLFWTLFIAMAYVFAKHLYTGAYDQAVYTGVGLMLMLNALLGE